MKTFKIMHTEDYNTLRMYYDDYDNHAYLEVGSQSIRMSERELVRLQRMVSKTLAAQRKDAGLRV